MILNILILVRLYSLVSAIGGKDSSRSVLPYRKPSSFRSITRRQTKTPPKRRTQTRTRITKTFTKNTRITRPDQEEGYSPSIFDLKAKERASSTLQTIRGFMKNHNHSLSTDKAKLKKEKLLFGNISLATLNAHVDNRMKEKSQQLILHNFIDTHHPSIFALQGATKGLVNYLLEQSNGHYRAACMGDRFREMDKMTRIAEFKPIIYDTSMFTLILEVPFNPKAPNQTYATMALFKNKKTSAQFAVVNMDLYSVSEKTNQMWFATILSNYFGSRLTRDVPVFFMGTIESYSMAERKLFAKGVSNLLNKDENNNGMMMGTFHGHGTYNDGKERDFVLLMDVKKQFRLNYIRILNGFDKENFMHYPIYAILSFAPEHRKSE